jgi:microcystin-dependent protein
MADPFIGEIKMVGFNYAPRGWAFCDGQILQISQNQSLFSLLGTTFGGDGRTTFGLPDLRDRSPLGVGNNTSWGQKGGEQVHVLISQEMPMHTHQPIGDTNTASQTTPVDNFWASQSANPFSTSQNTPMIVSTGITGGGQPHPNMQPFLTVNFIIALVGIYPTRT